MPFFGSRLGWRVERFWCLSVDVLRINNHDINSVQGNQSVSLDKDLPVSFIRWFGHSWKMVKLRREIPPTLRNLFFSAGWQNRIETVFSPCPVFIHPRFEQSHKREAFHDISIDGSCQGCWLSGKNSSRVAGAGSCFSATSS